MFSKPFGFLIFSLFCTFLVYESAYPNNYTSVSVRFTLSGCNQFISGDFNGYDKNSNGFIDSKDEINNIRISYQSADVPSKSLSKPFSDFAIKYDLNKKDLVFLRIFDSEKYRIWLRWDHKNSPTIEFWGPWMNKVKLCNNINHKAVQEYARTP
jgi:hypothetical protein